MKINEQQRKKLNQFVYRVLDTVLFDDDFDEIEKILTEDDSIPIEPPVILQNAVKEKIVEMMDKYTEHLKTPHVKGNEYLTNRYEGKIDALETLMIELMRNSILSK